MNATDMSTGLRRERDELRNILVGLDQRRQEVAAKLLKIEGALEALAQLDGGEHAVIEGQERQGA